ncbi:hypothetical protein BGZ57DRAFT_911417 [Hyaloscypha finlandica]|nr:hypothetical protein BGZ57DRAFT_911417 [Hyaloscypha finlandica]
MRNSLIASYACLVPPFLASLAGNDCTDFAFTKVSRTSPFDQHSHTRLATYFAQKLLGQVPQAFQSILIFLMPFHREQPSPLPMSRCQIPVCQRRNRPQSV